MMRWRRWGVWLVLVVAGGALAPRPCVPALPVEDQVGRPLRGHPASPPATRVPALTAALAHIRSEEYRPSLQTRDGLGREMDGPRLHFANRAQGLRACFDRRGLELFDRLRHERLWGYRLERIVRAGRAARDLDDLDIDAAVEPRMDPDGARIVYERGAADEWYVNRPAGIEQGFTLRAPPEGQGPLRIEGRVTASAAGRVAVGGLWVQDARGRELPSRMESSTAVGGTELLALVIDDAGAEYPLQVDPLITAAAFNTESDQVDAELGAAVALAGDVNADGFGDVIIGAPKFDNGQADEGRGFVFHGSGAGIAGAASFTAESNQTGAQMGYAVAVPPMGTARWSSRRGAPGSWPSWTGGFPSSAGGPTSAIGTRCGSSGPCAGGRRLTGNPNRPERRRSRLEPCRYLNLMTGFAPGSATAFQCSVAFHSPRPAAARSLLV